MPDIFDQRRDEHLKKSQAFLQEANNLFRDDLLYRSALADAVSAIKHSLQGYLWMRVAAAPAGEQRQRWQEVALNGSMPQLLRASEEAGLQTGDVRRTVLDMNDRRNERTHDSPRSLITPDQAEQAVRIARAVYDRVLRASGRAPVGVGTAASAGKSTAAAATQTGTRPTEPVRVGPAIAGGSSAGTLAPRPPTPTPAGDRAPANGKTAAPDAESTPPVVPAVPDDPDDGPLGPLSDDPLPLRHRRGTAWRWIGLAAAVVISAVMGAAVTYPVAAGDVPSWVPIRGYLPGPATTATSMPTPTITAVPIPSGPIQLGTLVITVAACGTTPRTLTLENTGPTAVAWAAGSPDVPGSALALVTAKGAGAARPTLAGRLTAHGSVAFALAAPATGPAHVVVIADAGTAEVALAPC
ncbi:MAG TPA: hypothetical protein VIC85_17085 [Ktedonobacterales bacterium]|jgi:hypothetical protein